MTRSHETHRITWRGIILEIRYEAQWLGLDGPFATAHLEIEAIDPARSPLPMTETGYRSHFTQAIAIDEAGGPSPSSRHGSRRKPASAAGRIGKRRRGR